MSPTSELEHRLALNENPYGPLPSVRAALRGARIVPNRYPEYLPRRLPAMIAERLGLPSEQVVIGAGATGVITYILREFVAPGDGVVMATPTFDGYPLLTEAINGRAVQIPLTADGHQDLDAMVDAVDADTRVVVLCSPHNPTGTRIDQVKLEGLLDRVDPSVIVVLDEAYIEFVAVADRVATTDLVARYPNLVVTRTFSKAYGLAALRVGYAFGAVPVIAKIRRWQLPFRVTTLAEAGVRACYDAEAELAVRTAAITHECGRLTEGLRGLGFAVPTSAANFVYLNCCGNAEIDRLRAAFVRDGIQVKHCGTGIRIIVGNAVATDAVLAASR
ncbi:pyridoxal phosphate-dependent aminotransferase [Nocardia sp. NPDC050630]|uniref:pyridoxal phosphate-dependent aminotransferase n=1 Tax=Nocardia sp. NPDC050630 TaxID=3364321 RepID=UPI0037A783B7